jgi:hypothetical protein
VPDAAVRAAKVLDRLAQAAQADVERDDAQAALGARHLNLQFSIQQ